MAVPSIPAPEAARSQAAKFKTSGSTCIRKQVAFDPQMSAFLLPKSEMPLCHLRGAVPTTADVRQQLGDKPVYGPIQGKQLSYPSSSFPLACNRGCDYFRRGTSRIESPSAEGREAHRAIVGQTAPADGSTRLARLRLQTHFPTSEIGD